MVYLVPANQYTSAKTVYGDLVQYPTGYVLYQISDFGFYISVKKYNVLCSTVLGWWDRKALLTATWIIYICIIKNYFGF